jgi:hypothetical protein
MNDWDRYVRMKSLREQWEDRVASCKQRLRNGDLHTPEGQLIRQEISVYETVLNEFVSHLDLPRE